MYHAQYTRRRTTDSFVDEEEARGSIPSRSWSWRLFVAVLLVQVTSRSLWTSLGVIGCALWEETVPAWHLLATPTVFALCWGITEECMGRVCARMGRADDFMFAVLAGAGISLLGSLIAVRYHLSTTSLVLVIGFVGGCGASMAGTAGIELVRKHFPAKPGAVRFCQQSTTALSFFIVPVFSYYMMDMHVHSGGLLMHSGVIMQGLIGGVLIRGARWEDERDAVCNREYGAFFPSDYGSDIDDGYPAIELQTMSPTSPGKVLRHPPLSPPTSPTRVAFGLGKVQAKDSSEVRRQIFSMSRGLPSITEEVEQEEVSDVQDDVFAKEESPSPKNVSLHIEEHEIPKANPPVADDQPSTSVLCSPIPPPTYEENTSPEVTRSMQAISTSSAVLCLEDLPAISSDLKLSLSPEASDPLLHNAPSPSHPSASPPKPARTFKHVFPPDRLLVNIEAARSSVERQTYDCETGEVHEAEGEESERVTPWRILLLCMQEAVLAVWLQTRRARPLAVPAALLLFASQTALLTFAGLTPRLLNYHIEDGGQMDGAYTLCVMGFTWLCFVLASPCFGNIHFSSHQIICMLSLYGSAATLYLMSTVKTQDEVVLYGSIFGLFHGVSCLTTRCVLMMAFGAEGLHQLGLPLNLLAGAFHLLTLLLISQCDIGDDIRELYKVPAWLILVSAVFWTVQGCILSIRASRQKVDITWSRRRRVSFN